MKFQTKNRGVDISTKKRDVHKAKHTAMRPSELKNDSIDLSKHKDGVHGVMRVYNQHGPNIICNTTSFIMETSNMRDAKNAAKSLYDRRMKEKKKVTKNGKKKK